MQRHTVFMTQFQYVRVISTVLHVDGRLYSRSHLKPERVEVLHKRHLISHYIDHTATKYSHSWTLCHNGYESLTKLAYLTTTLH